MKQKLYNEYDQKMLEFKKEKDEFEQEKLNFLKEK